MQKDTRTGLLLLVAGVGNAVAAVNAAEHGAASLALASGLLSGAATALGVTAVLIGKGARTATLRRNGAR